MKKFFIIFGLILSMTSLAYATMFCCPPEKTPEQCCSERGKLYCENDGKCRTKCLNVTPPECIGGCINPKGECCLWCPTAEVCAYKGLCQRIVDGCYTCDTCAPDCPSPKCLNEKGICCDSCPRTCPEGQCLVNVDGCYECRECETETTETTETTEITETEDKCVGKDKYKDCCECNPDTGEYDINCTTTEEKPECCNNTPYEGCPAGKVRNQTTCECECELTMEWCFENGGAVWDSNQCVCMGCKEGLDWCNYDCYPKCPDGQTRDGDCECRCLLGYTCGDKCCSGPCNDSGDGCKYVGKCGGVEMECLVTASELAYADEYPPEFRCYQDYYGGYHCGTEYYRDTYHSPCDCAAGTNLWETGECKGCCSYNGPDGTEQGECSASDCSQHGLHECSWN